MLTWLQTLGLGSSRSLLATLSALSDVVVGSQLTLPESSRATSAALPPPGSPAMDLQSKYMSREHASGCTIRCLNGLSGPGIYAYVLLYAQNYLQRQANAT